MLRSVVESFLDSVTEREFDSPLLAILASQGYYDIHFTHGAFEFGKDVIAKRIDAASGKPHQYAIQAKAGNIGMSEWRGIRPQIDEARENTLSHPNFDFNAPRVAVLATTGRLIGGAALDAQQLAERSRGSGAEFTTWDRFQFIEWLSADPTLAAGSDMQLLQVVARIDSETIREQDLEVFSRRWLPATEEQERSSSLPIEAAIVANRLRAARRLDLAAYTCLHLFRAAWARETVNRSSVRPRLANSALALFASYATELLGQASPFLNDANTLLQASANPYSILTYPAMCCRLNEILAILAILEEANPDLVESTTGGSAAAAVVSLSANPAAARPLSDDFAVAIIAPAVLLEFIQCGASGEYLARVAQWTQDRYDERAGGLGLGAHGEPEEDIAERLLGVDLESTHISRRRLSYIATVILDLASASENAALYEAFRQNLAAFDIVPLMSASPTPDGGARGGEHIRPLVSLSYQSYGSALLAEHHDRQPRLPVLDELILASSTRSRHNYAAIRDSMRRQLGKSDDS